MCFAMDWEPDPALARYDGQHQKPPLVIPNELICSIVENLVMTLSPQDALRLRLVNSQYQADMLEESVILLILRIELWNGEVLRASLSAPLPSLYHSRSVNLVKILPAYVRVALDNDKGNESNVDPLPICRLLWTAPYIIAKLNLPTKYPAAVYVNGLTYAFPVFIFSPRPQLPDPIPHLEGYLTWHMHAYESDKFVNMITRKGPLMWWPFNDEVVAIMAACATDDMPLLRAAWPLMFPQMTTRSSIRVRQFRFWGATYAAIATNSTAALQFVLENSNHYDYELWLWMRMAAALGHNEAIQTLHSYVKAKPANIQAVANYYNSPRYSPFWIPGTKSPFFDPAHWATLSPYELPRHLDASKHALSTPHLLVKHTFPRTPSWVTEILNPTWFALSRQLDIPSELE